MDVDHVRVRSLASIRASVRDATDEREWMDTARTLDPAAAPAATPEAPDPLIMAMAEPLVVVDGVLMPVSTAVRRSAITTVAPRRRRRPRIR